jgi:hypothetical protein
MRILIRMVDSVDSSKQQVGYRFTANLEANLQIGDVVVVPRGSTVYGRLANAKSAGNMSGGAELSLELTDIIINGTAYHHRIAAAIERCIPIQQVMSCDEFACQLLGRERTLLRATAIAYEIKRELRTVGITLRCSVGLAPNRLLAKIAGDMQKPDGLMIFERRYLPQALYSLELADIPGIGKRMEQRILAEGIYHHASTVRSHTRADAHDMGRRLRRPIVALAAR